MSFAKIFASSLALVAVPDAGAGADTLVLPAPSVERTGPVTAIDRVFSTRPMEQGQGWPDYQIIMWQSRTPTQYTVLRQLGITAGMVMARRDTVDRLDVDRQVAPLLEAGLRYFVENI